MSKSMCKRRGGWDEMGGNRWWYSMKGEGEDMLGKKSNIILQTKLSVEEKFFFADFLNYVESDTSVKGCKCCDICAKKCDCDQCTVAA